MTTSSPEQIEQEIEQTRQDLRDEVEAIKDKVSPTQAMHRSAARIGDTMTEARDRIMGTATDTRDRVMDTAEDKVDRGRRSAVDVADKAKSQARGNPLAVGLGAFAFGWLVSSMLPASQQERRAAQTLRDSDQVKSVTEPLAESARSLAGDVAQDAKEAARKVGEEAKAGVETVRDQASGSSESESQEFATPGLSTSGMREGSESPYIR